MVSFAFREFAERRAAGAGGQLAAGQGCSDLLEGERQLLLHSLRRQAEDAKAERQNDAVPPGVGVSPPGVIGTVNFNDEASRWRTEISDEATDDDLPLETGTEFSAANGLPEKLFRMRERSAHARGAGDEQLSARGIELRFFQESLLVPVKWPGAAPAGAGCVTRADVLRRVARSRGTQRAPLREARPLHRDEARRKLVSTNAPRWERPALTLRHLQELQKGSAPSRQPNSPSVGALPRRVYLPHSRAARAGASKLAISIAVSRAGAREHEFGEGRAPAGGSAAEDARVGATPAQIVQEHDGPLCVQSPAAVAVETIQALHSDLHGSVTAATTIGATPSTSRQAFSPWGEREPLASGSASINAIDKVTVGFTDQEQDDAVGLINMRGRVYDSITRTFLSDCDQSPRTSGRNGASTSAG